MKLVGKVAHFYPKISVAVIEVLDEIKVGDKIAIKGKTTNFEQIVESMQIEHKQVEKASKGDSVGLKVIERVREGDEVFKIEE
mgnify:CR=1 FL=1